MTRREHVRKLADEHDVLVWICENCEGEPYGEAFERGYIHLTQAPEHSREAYLVALHELGHFAGVIPWSGLRLDHEASAWIWAVENARLRMRPADWAVVEASLESYTKDRRYRHTELFTELLEDVRSRARAY